MILDEKLRWAGFWILDGLRGGQTRKYYDRIRYAWKEGSSVAETEERIRNLIRHAVKTTDFYKDYPEDTPLEKLPVVNKDTFRQHYDSFLSSTYKDAEDNRVMCTSGSTGTPLRMIQNKDKICHNTAGGIFLGAAAGYYIGMKEAFIRVWVNNVRKSKLRLFQENLIMMDSSRMDDKALAGMLDVIEKKKVKSRSLRRCQNLCAAHCQNNLAVRCVHGIPTKKTALWAFRMKTMKAIILIPKLIIMKY